MSFKTAGFSFFLETQKKLFLAGPASLFHRMKVNGDHGCKQG